MCVLLRFAPSPSDTIAPMIVKEPVSTPSKTATTWWPLAILVAVNVLNFYDRQVAGAVVEPVRKEFLLSDTQIGALNTVSLILYGLVGLPLGLLADKVSRKKLLAAGIVVWAAFTACARFVHSYSFLMVTRLGVGVGEATAAPTATSWIGDLFPAERRSKPSGTFYARCACGWSAKLFLYRTNRAPLWMAYRHGRSCSAGAPAGPIAADVA